jgi:hypothetical protein
LGASRVRGGPNDVNCEAFEKYLDGVTAQGSAPVGVGPAKPTTFSPGKLAVSTVAEAAGQMSEEDLPAIASGRSSLFQGSSMNQACETKEGKQGELHVGQRFRECAKVLLWQGFKRPSGTLTDLSKTRA